MAGQVETRLAALGFALPPVPSPAGAYVPAVRAGAMVYTAGQLPLVAGVLPRTGKVGADLSAAQATELAAVAAGNALAAVRSVVADLDEVVRVLKVTGYVASAPDFTGQAGVLNGASELLHAVFGTAGVHARAAVGVAVLPLDAPVEVELIVEVRS